MRDADEDGEAGDRGITVRADDRDLLASAATVVVIVVVIASAGRVTANERDRVRNAVAGAAAESRREVDVELLDVGPAEVVHDRVVGAAESTQVDALGVVDVHDDAAGAPEEAKPLPVGRGVEVLGPTRAVEDERVIAAPTLDAVTAVARIPRETVVAGAHERPVGALVSVCIVVVGSAGERL